MSDFENVKSILSANAYTCVLCKGERIYTSKDRGVKPLVAWYESEIDFHGFSAADKVVGRGAAFLYVLLGICAVYANVISSPALELLKAHGIHVEYAVQTDHIINRKGDGFCPFEAAVTDVEDVTDAYRVIRKKMEELHLI